MAETRCVGCPRVVGAGLVFTVAALLTVAAAPASADSRWTLLTAGNLTIIGDQSPATLRDIALQIEQFQVVVGGLIRNADRPPSVPTIVYVVGNKKALDPLVPLYKGKPASIAGFFGQSSDMNHIVMSLEGFDESTQIAYHEYTHLLVRNAVRTLPVWLNEGLAEYYSTYHLIDRGKAATVGRAQRDHILLLRERYLPIATLIDVDQSSPMYNEGERRTIFYAESWALTHYLMVARPNGGETINRYVHEIAEGRPPVEAFTTAFGKTPVELDKELRDYLRGLTFKEYRYQFADKVSVAEPGPGRQLTAGEVDAWLGDAQRRVHREAEGAPRIERAAAAEPDNATTQMALGLLRVSQNKLDEGFAALGRAASLAPHDFVTQFVCGVARVYADPRGSEEHRRQALVTLKQATQLNGASAEAYATLAYVQMLSEETLADARASIEQAVALAPGRIDYWLRYADVRLLQGDRAGARAMLTPIAAITFDRRSAEAARERLDVITEHERERARVQAQRDALPAGPPTAAASPGSAASDGTKAAPETTAAGRDVAPHDETTERRGGLILRAVRAGEERALGRLLRIDCSSDAVRFTVDADGRHIVAAAARMEDIQLTAFGDDRNFTISCGPRPPNERVLVTWRPDDRWGPGANGTAVAVEFVPPSFKP